jgi:hypothetical protein
MAMALAAGLMQNRYVPISEVCGEVGVPRAILYRYLTADGTLREQLKVPPT